MRGAATVTVSLLAALLALAGGCGESEPDSTPEACLGGASAFLSALRTAPEAVRLDGEARISDCLVPGQEGGELATVGSAMVRVATQLNGEARRDSGGEAAVQLGYLVAAAERGAADAGGIHADLLRRLEAAARFAPEGGSPGEEFERAYERGFAAGERDG